jgi:23S rRNA (cytosine1962-C5)-methyltransferase
LIQLNPMPLSKNDYRLLDFGDGRKLELVGGAILDRPSPAADNVRKREPGRWREAHLRFDPQASKPWRRLRDVPEPWIMPLGSVSMLLRPTPFGHIGIFPEQQQNWKWFQELAVKPSENEPSENEPRPVKRCLNLFAYTGASSLVLANAGWHVTHVDASRPTLLWGRENAAASGLGEAPIRWIQEDAHRFVEREVRRGNRYDLVLLDPPSFGHGPKGERWSIEEGMLGLLKLVFEVLCDQPTGVLWTGHSDTELIQPLIKEVEKLANDAGLRSQRLQRATIEDDAGRCLDFGYRLRWLAVN